MNFIKKVLPVILGLFLVAGTAFAQVQQGQQGEQVTSEDVTDQELEAMSEFAVKSRTIQQEANQKLQQELNKHENLTIQRFQTIMTSKRNPQMADSVEVSEEEQAAMKKVQPKLMEINQNAQNKALAVIKEVGLTRQRLQAIQVAMQSDKDLQKRFQKLMMQKQQEAADSSNS